MANPPPALALATETRPALLCLSHLRWDFVWQRPQHLMKRAARTHDVIFFEEPLPLAPGEKPHVAARQALPGMLVAQPRIPFELSPDAQEALVAGLLEEFVAQNVAGSLVTWFYTPMALPLTANLASGLIIYDCMDELSLFKGASPRLKRLEQALFRKADIVFTGGHSLYEHKRAQHHSIWAEPSSIDPAHFGAARSRIEEPACQRGIAGPRIGFFGVIDERMDLALVAGLAEARPDWQFVMIGPVVKIDPESLPRACNLHWLGPRSYGELPAYLSGWDAGFMPFAINDSTRFISPTKTPEFLAAGLPVVSTAITDVVRPYGVKGLVGIAEGAQAFAAALDAAMRRPKVSFLADVDAELARTSWDMTWQRMSQRMRQAQRAKRKTPDMLPAALAASHV